MRDGLRKMLSGKNLAIALLALLLVFSLGYIVSTEYNRRQSETQLAVFQLGMQEGYKQTVLAIFQQGLTCQPVPLYVENQTINMVAVECLQQAVQQAQQEQAKQ